MAWKTVCDPIYCTAVENAELPRETMTAREMALTPHNLSRTGEIAFCADGRVFCWACGDKIWWRTK